jgi:hypothetical protein
MATGPRAQQANRRPVLPASRRPALQAQLRAPRAVVRRAAQHPPLIAARMATRSPSCARWLRAPKRRSKTMTSTSRTSSARSPAPAKAPATRARSCSRSSYRRMSRTTAKARRSPQMSTPCAATRATASKPSINSRAERHGILTGTARRSGRWQKAAPHPRPRRRAPLETTLGAIVHSGFDSGQCWRPSVNRLAQIRQTLAAQPPHDVDMGAMPEKRIVGDKPNVCHAWQRSQICVCVELVSLGGTGRGACDTLVSRLLRQS